MAHRIPDSRQVALAIDEGEPMHGPFRRPAPTPFNEPDPDEIFFGEQPLARFLEAQKQGWVVEMSRFLREVDLTVLMTSYSSHAGQPPLHPRLLLGLVLYGFMRGLSSLRLIEELARLNLAAMYLSGGLTPDHSTIGRFLVRHSDALTERFFVEITTELLKRLGKKHAGATGMDGTVIEAVASRFAVAKAEAIKEAAKEAAARSANAPDDEKLREAATTAAAAAKTATERQETRKVQRVAGDPSLAITDPDAVVQPRKDGPYRPAYKSSVMATEDRIIVGLHVHPSNELKSVAPMLEQYNAIMNDQPTALMGDAGYHAASLLRTLVASEINALIPAGRESSPGMEEQRKKIAKSAFIYDANLDVYRCPRQKLLILEAVSDGKDPCRRYRCHDCAECPDRPKCTTAKRGRAIERRPDDDIREAMAEVLKQPRARKEYAQRKVMVEPVFSVLADRQRLRRFRRRGLRRVRMEFAVHCIAYNVRTALRVAERAVVRAMKRILARFTSWRVLAELTA